MAELQFELVSPERSLASLQVTEVQLPGTDGDMTAMADHAPVITNTASGHGSGRLVSRCHGIFRGPAVLPKLRRPGPRSWPRRPTRRVTEGARQAVEEQLELARKKLEEAEGDHRDTTEKVVADFVSASGEHGVERALLLKKKGPG